MIRLGVADTSTRSGVVNSRPIVVIFAALLLLLLALPPVSACLGCENICDHSHSEFMPQLCDECCKGQNGNEDTNANKRMEGMESAIKELRVMVGVILGLLALLIMLAVVVLLRHTSTKALKATLPVFFRSKDEGRASIEKRPPPSNKVPAENRNSTVVRIANYQNNHSPLTKRMRPNGQVVHEDVFPPPVDTSRRRQPSESTCPDDSDLSPPHQDDLPPGAYVNLALSTSTLHDTTTSSTSTLGPAVSTNTLDTTLPSVNPMSPGMN